MAPAFSFLLVEGYFHTRNKRRYLKRLLIGALVVGIGNIVYDLLIKSYIGPFDHQPNYLLFLGPHNIFLTLALQLIMMWSLDNILNKHKYHKQAPMLGATFLWCALLFAKAYYSYSSRATASGTLYEHLTFASEFMMVTVIPLIWLYNDMVVKLKNRSSISFIQFTFGSFT